MIAVILFLRTTTLLSPQSISVLFRAHIAYKYYKMKCAARYYPSIFLFTKSTDETFLLPSPPPSLPSDFESFIARNVPSIHLRGRGVSRRLNIYDCREISTAVIPRVSLRSDIQTRHPCDCKGPERYFRSRRSIDLGSDSVCNQ